MADNGEGVFDLEYTKENSHRVYVGLSWDPRKASGLYEKFQKLKGFGVDISPVFKGKKPEFFLDSSPLYIAQREMEGDTAEASRENRSYDLDLTCYMLDKQGNSYSVVSPKTFEMCSSDKSVYHTGDDFDGGGGGDDEIVFIEFKRLPEDVDQLIFCVTSKNLFDLSEVEGAVVRIVDSQPEKELLRYELKDHAEKGHTAFVFCRIFREGDGWKVEKTYDFTTREMLEQKFSDG